MPEKTGNHSVVSQMKIRHYDPQIEISLYDPQKCADDGDGPHAKSMF